MSYPIRVTAQSAVSLRFWPPSVLRWGLFGLLSLSAICFTLNNLPVVKAALGDSAELAQDASRRKNKVIDRAALPRTPDDVTATAYSLPNAPSAPAPPAVATDAWQQQLSLAAQSAVKITVTQDGLYRVTGAELTGAGLAPSADAAKFQLFVAGQPVPLLVQTAQGLTNGPLGAAGYIEFYGQALDTAHTNGQVYWLISGAENPLRYGPPVFVAPSGGGGDEETGTFSSKGGTNVSATAENFPSLAQRKDRIYNIITTHNVAAENFYGGVAGPTAFEQNIVLTDLAANANYAANIEVALQGIPQNVAHNVRISLNDQELGTVQYNHNAYYRARFNVPNSLLREGPNKLKLQSLNGSNDVSALDYWNITYARRYRAVGNQLRFTAPPRQAVTLEGFTAPNVRVMDITDPQRIFEIASYVHFSPNGSYNVRVNGELAGRQLLALTPQNYLTPAALTPNAPSTWTQATRRADFLIISYGAFREAVAPLAQVRQSQGLQTEIVDIQDIYDEWNGGAPSPTALRDFLRWTNEKWSLAPRYVLLVGDASADPRNYLGLNKPDFVTSYPVDAVAFETVSDEIFGDFDNDNVAEIAIGRWPARTAAEAAFFTAKTLSYQPLGNNVGTAFIADRPNGYFFENAQSQLRSQLPETAPRSTLLSRTPLTDAAMRQQLLATLNRGPALVNYFGHGYNDALMSPTIFTNADALMLTNSRLSIYVIMSCLTGQFHDIYTESLAESLMRAPNGGAVAVWASTSLPYASSQPPANRRLMQALYGAGSAVRLGDAVRQAKLAANDEVRRCWVLLGDPTLFFRE